MAVKNKVYISGASGRLGSSVLAKTGGTPLVRKPGITKDEIVTDFSTDQLKGIFKDAKAVIHLAGSVDTLDRKALHESNVALTWRIVDSLPEDTKIIFASSISVYGKRLAKVPADEGTKTNPDTYYAKSKYDAEEIVGKHKNNVILRIGTIYGPQFEDYFMILKRIELGKMKLIGKGDNRVPFIHVDDVAEAIKAAIDKGTGTYNLAGDPVTEKRLFELAAEDLGVKPPSNSVPVTAAMLMAAAGERWYSIRHVKPPLTREHVAILASDRAFDCTKARNDLGFHPRPIEQGMKEMVEEYKRRKA